MRLSLFCFICFLALHSFAQNINFQWAKAFGSNKAEYLHSMAVDKNENVYSTGYFAGSIDFDPDSNAVHNLHAQNNIDDTYLQKLDKNGNLVWAKSFGSISNDKGYGVVIDDSGYVYLSGIFTLNGDFDPHPNRTTTLTSNGSFDVYLLKLDSAGNLLWATSFGGPRAEYIVSMDIDANNNLILAGYFQGTVDFDPGTTTRILSTTNNVRNSFVSKFDSNGNFIWAGAFTGPTDNRVTAVRTGNNNEILVTGNFRGMIDFDPGPGVSNMTSNVFSSNDVYVVKLDSNQNFVWAKSYGSNNNDASYDMALDNEGNILLTGDFQGTVNFSTGASATNITAIGMRDIYVSKLNSQGNLLWAKAFQPNGTTGNYSGGEELTTDRFGNVFVTGFFTGIVDFDPGVGVHNDTSRGSNDFFLTKLDKSGNFIWAQTIGAISTQQGNEVTVMPNGNIYFAGHYASYTDFNPFSGTYFLNYRGLHRDMFVEKLGCTPVVTVDTITACDTYTWRNGKVYTESNTLDEIGLQSAGGCDSIIQLHLTILKSSSYTDTLEACDSLIWIDGNTYASNNSTATYTLTNAVGCDSIVTLNLTINSTYQIQQFAACDSFIWSNGITYYSSNNTAEQVLQNAKACDSIIALDLIINNSITTVDSLVACDSLTWIDGVTYTNNNNTATHLLSAVSGCDSLVSLHLTINYSEIGIDTIVTCDSLLWVDGNIYTSSNNTATYTYTNSAGCDSTVRLDLTILNSKTRVDSIVACDSITWIDGQTYTMNNNTATYSLMTTDGCDSTIRLNLTIENLNTATSVNGTTITANETNAFSYQWLDCGNGYVRIPGATNRSYTATVNGNYAVELNTPNSCSDTSLCVPIVSVGLNEKYGSESFNIFPNPTSDELNIQFPEALVGTHLLIINAIGTVVYEDQIQGPTMHLALENVVVCSGMYFLKVGARIQKVVYRK